MNNKFTVEEVNLISIFTEGDAAPDLGSREKVIKGISDTMEHLEDDEMIELLEKLKWWDRTPNEIQKIIPLLANSNLSYVREELKLILSKKD